MTGPGWWTGKPTSQRCESCSSDCSRAIIAGDFPARTPVDELSGGEGRRLALMRLLMAGPNVLLQGENSIDYPDESAPPEELIVNDVSVEA